MVIVKNKQITQKIPRLKNIVQGNDTKKGRTPKFFGTSCNFAHIFHVAQIFIKKIIPP